MSKSPSVPNLQGGTPKGAVALKVIEMPNVNQNTRPEPSRTMSGNSLVDLNFDAVGACVTKYRITALIQGGQMTKLVVPPPQLPTDEGSNLLNDPDPDSADHDDDAFDVLVGGTPFLEVRCVEKFD